jgi:hypothetical protein
VQRVREGRRLPQQAAGRRFGQREAGEGRRRRVGEPGPAPVVRLERLPRVPSHGQIAGLEQQHVGVEVHFEPPPVRFGDLDDVGGRPVTADQPSPSPEPGDHGGQLRVAQRFGGGRAPPEDPVPSCASAQGASDDPGGRIGADVFGGGAEPVRPLCRPQVVGGQQRCRRGHPGRCGSGLVKPGGQPQALGGLAGQRSFPRSAHADEQPAQQ